MAGFYRTSITKFSETGLFLHYNNSYNGPSKSLDQAMEFHFIVSENETIS